MGVADSSDTDVDAAGAIAAVGAMTAAVAGLSRDSVGGSALSRDSGSVAAPVTQSEFVSSIAPSVETAPTTSATQVGDKVPFLDYRPVQAANVPSYVLATSGLSNEQKLEVALCRPDTTLANLFAGTILGKSYE